MKELWIQATESYNLPLTIGLIFFCGYWIISSIGIFDFDADVDVELDADIDINGGVFSSMLNFVNAADVPVMFVLTIINLSMWVISMISNDLLNPVGSLTVAGWFFIINFILSVIITKYITKPMAPLFHAIKNDVEAAEPLVGQSGKVKSRVLDHHYGQVTVLRNNTAPALVNCRLRESDEPLVRGEEILILSYDEKTKKYIVRALPSIKDEASPGLTTNQKSDIEESTEEQHLTE